MNRRLFSSRCEKCGHPQREHRGGPDIFSCACGCQATAAEATAIPVHTRGDWFALPDSVKYPQGGIYGFEEDES